ncbi:TonB-dependent receptor [Sphingomonas nostoxanthinifaciens]|uniref:TonB-dependent receptor n=1 Tax=Sphingomonas nostoxanthinifaciens TaxID=2872652 RepID=UPI001CC1F955|nr:TonB-dependent receptor [Sphingomonas nostoxanthinifaciens]UAK25782.1 TonB-dependent receptor [Sphingomonas nostoxanthinifaciens]
MWAFAAPVDRVEAAPIRVDVPAGRFRESLSILAGQAHISIGTSGALPSLRTPAVRGTMEPGDALNALLAGSAWQAVPATTATWSLVRRARRDRKKPVAEPASPVDDDILVSATKRDEQLGSAPASVTIIGGAQMVAGSAARGSSDFTSQTEGAFSTNMGPGRDRIFLRGVADSPFNGPTQSTVGLFLDDARVNYAMPDPDLRLTDIDRIEILRGPQGSLYGTGSLGGIVRIVTTRPDVNAWSGMSAVEVSSVAHSTQGGALEDVLNAPIVAGKLAVRAVAYGDITPGWIDDAGRGETDVNRVSRVGGRIDLRWLPASAWTVDLSGALQELRARDSQYAVASLSRSTALAEPHRNHFVLARADVRGTIGALDFLSTSAYEHNQVLSRFDTGATPPVAYDEARRLTLFSEEARLSDPRARRPWVAGISVVDAINRTMGTFTSASQPTQVARDEYSRSLEAAIFGEITQPLGPAWDLTLGLRAYHASNRNESALPALLVNKKTGATPSAVLAWHPAEGRLVWLRYASAVRPGGLSQDSSGANAVFRSDVLKSLELGGRFSFLDGRLTLNGALFGLSWQHLQSDIIGTDGLIVTINAGNATNYGLELGSTFKLAAFTFSAGLTQQRGRLKSSTITGGLDSRLPVLPDISAHSRVSWQRQYRTFGADAYLSASYLGSSRLSFDPSLDRTTPSHFDVDAGAGLSRDSWRLSIGISNILNTKDDTFSFGNPFTIRQADQHTPYQPRTATLRFERHF